MSQANFNDNEEAPVYRKPRADLYTGMLIVALIALIIGCVCLYAEMSVYQFKFKGGPVVYRNQPAASAIDAVPSALTSAAAAHYV